MKRIGVLGGSFDPVHIGHTALANYIAQSGLVDEVWLTLSPQNPFKADRNLTEDTHRMEMLRIATAQDHIIRPCDVELSMPRPSYTIDTLRKLSEMYQQCSFCLIIGGDNWANFNRWREYRKIIEDYGVNIYPRPGFEISHKELPDNVVAVDAPMVEVSSTWLRQAIAGGRDVNYFMPAGVYPYIINNHLYQPDRL